MGGISCILQTIPYGVVYNRLQINQFFVYIIKKKTVFRFPQVVGSGACAYLLVAFGTRWNANFQFYMMSWKSQERQNLQIPRMNIIEISYAGAMSCSCRTLPDPLRVLDASGEENWSNRSMLYIGMNIK